ncbi:MAG TPA: response regulator [Leptospiraceae bacterium]|nr:response regulator [Leptospiraceae bacterium]
MEKGFILCVDDEVSVLETLREQLRQHFGQTHDIEVASSAEEALSLISQIRDSGGLIEVIITDQVMPGIKGDHFLEEVQKQLPDTIKILLTGHAGLASAIHAINKGGLNRYIEKPWNMDNLKDDISQLIHRFREHVENQRMLSLLERRLAQMESESAEMGA